MDKFFGKKWSKKEKLGFLWLDSGGMKRKKMGTASTQGKKKSGSCESLFIQYYIIA